MKTRLILGLMVTGMAAGCGGSGSGSGGDDVTPPVIGPVSGTTYRDITDTTGGVVALNGAFVTGGAAVSIATGEIDLPAQSFQTGADSGTIGSTSGLLSGAEYDFATDVSVGPGFEKVGVIGVATDITDIRDATITYSGEFGGQLIRSAGAVDDLNDWDAQLTVDFRGSGDVEATFSGGGSDLVNKIDVTGATINGNTFSGGTLQTSGGAGDNVTGTSVDFAGGFFGYSVPLDAPAEAGGVLLSEGNGRVLYGVFIADGE